MAPPLRQGYNRRLLNNTVLDHFPRLERQLPDFFSPEPPALLMDLAMTTLLHGGFDPTFYQTYDHHYPLPPNHRLQWGAL